MSKVKIPSKLSRSYTGTNTPITSAASLGPTRVRTSSESGGGGAAARKKSPKKNNRKKLWREAMQGSALQQQKKAQMIAKMKANTKLMYTPRLNSLHPNNTFHFEYKKNITEARRIVEDMIQDKSLSEQKRYRAELYRIFETGEHSIYREIRIILQGKHKYSDHIAEEYINFVKAKNRDSYIRPTYETLGYVVKSYGGLDPRYNDTIYNDIAVALGLITSQQAEIEVGGIKQRRKSKKNKKNTKSNKNKKKGKKNSKKQKK